VAAVAIVKSNAAACVRGLIVRMRERFPDVKLVRATRFIYPDEINDPRGGAGAMKIAMDFQSGLRDIEALLRVHRTWKGSSLPPVIDTSRLVEQFSAYYSAAQPIASAVLSTVDLPPERQVSEFWSRLERVEGSAQQYSEWLKLAKVTLVQGTSSAQDERVFSLMKLLKTCLRNKLGDKHLQACMRAKMQNFIELVDLEGEVGSAIMREWMLAKERRF
jgi:hypothetical protein